MNKDKRSILLGMCIGDGYIGVSTDKRWNTKSYVLRLCHSVKQKAYLEHKTELLHSALGGKKPRIVEYNNNGYPGVKCSKTNKYFKVLRDWLYKDGEKVVTRRILDMLTPQGIAIWHMDDGSLYTKRRNGKVHAWELCTSTYVSWDENQVIVDYFRDVHGIRFTIVKGKGKYRIRCGTKEAKKFIEIVKPFIIPSMLYKVRKISDNNDSSQERPAPHVGDDIVRTPMKVGEIRFKRPYDNKS